MLKRYIHKATNRTRSSNVTATIYSGKRVTLVKNVYFPENPKYPII